MRTIEGTFTITDDGHTPTLTITEEGSVPIDVTSWDLTHLIARLDKYRPQAPTPKASPGTRPQAKASPGTKQASPGGH